MFAQPHECALACAGFCLNFLCLVEFVYLRFKTIFGEFELHDQYPSSPCKESLDPPRRLLGVIS